MKTILTMMMTMMKVKMNGRMWKVTIACLFQAVNILVHNGSFCNLIFEPFPIWIQVNTYSKCTEYVPCSRFHVCSILKGHISQYF